MQLWQTNPMGEIVLTRGAGATVWDSAGKAYLDMQAGTWCVVLGHGHPRWLVAVQEQAAQLAHAGAAFRAETLDAALAALQTILPPELNRVVWLSTGSEAVELALKMAHAATGRDATAVIAGGYYGATAHALALSEVGRAMPYLPDPGPVYRLPAPTCAACPLGQTWPCGDLPCTHLPPEALAAPPAALIYEPVMANAGVIVPPPGYESALRQTATACGALLIAEEVTTGLGRTGEWFGFQHDGIVPDILVIGKAIGNGLPVAAVVTTEAVEAACAGAVLHVQSHQNDPLSGRIAQTVIDVLRAEALVARAAALGAYLLAGLRDLQRDHAMIADVRGKGLLAALELRPEAGDLGARLDAYLLDHGVILGYQARHRAFRCLPPFVITERELDRVLDTLDAGLRALT